jgi:hypothetical protein
MFLKRNYKIGKHVMDGVYEARRVSNSLEGEGGDVLPVCVVDVSEKKS